MSNILIIGSKGFIGSHLEAHLRQKGHQVWGADVVADYAAKNYFLIDPSTELFIEAFQETPFDVCFNCSGAANVSDSFVHPRRDFFLNTCNVFYLLDAIRLYQPTCRFVQLSSAAVYGNPQSLPVKESDPVGPMSPYGWHKLQAEQLCKEFYDAYGVKSAIARIFSAYGPGLKKQLFWDLYQKLQKGGTVRMFGTGKESRDFIYISDLVTALEAIAMHEHFKATCINIASGTQTTIEEVCTTFLTHYHASTTIEFTQETKQGDPLNWEADVRLLKSMGYAPSVSLEKGIKHYIEWARK